MNNKYKHPSVTGAKVVQNRLGQWMLIDRYGWSIVVNKKPSELRRHKRGWFLYLTVDCDERAAQILEGDYK
jgi:hypothetical protein